MRKRFSIMGMVVCSLIVIFGILLLAGVLKPFYSYVDTPGYLYDYGYAQFGADFYSHVNNNAALAAKGTQSIAANQKKTLSVYGIMMIGFGLFGICLFGTLMETPKTFSGIDIPQFNTDVIESQVPKQVPTNPENEKNEQGDLG